MSDTILLYGKHSVLAALANPKRQLVELYVTSERQLASVSNHIKTRIISPKELSGLLPEGAVHQGWALKARPLPIPSLKDISHHKILLILDQITDPHNIGAIMRSAFAFSVGAILITKDHSPSPSGTLAKAACGALEHVPLIPITNVSRAIEELKKSGFWCVGLDSHAETPLSEAKFDNTILVLGAEGKGIRPLVKKHCDILTAIPIHPECESLNVSNAAAVALYAIGGRNL